MQISFELKQQSRVHIFSPTEKEKSMRKVVISGAKYTEVDGMYRRWYVSVSKHAAGCLSELELRQYKKKLFLVLGNSSKTCHVNSILITSQGINQHVTPKRGTFLEKSCPNDR